MARAKPAPASAQSSATIGFEAELLLMVEVERRFSLVEQLETVVNASN